MRNIRPFLYLALIALMVACASIGSPDGGMYDETPPRVVSSSPADKSTGAKKKKIEILFNEYIKLENASEKVIVSPPQIEPANIRADGKKIKITLYDTLQANTTYTVDFSDAITDNNEGNPMGKYTYSFSTGDVIDTMEVSGTVLNAEDLEPIKGMLVGVYPYDSSFCDTILYSTPMARVSRTNGLGQFTVKGLKSGKYRAFALDDKDGNFVFSQKSERVAFNTQEFEVYSKPDVYMDTIWRDSTRYDSILVKPYTHYYPDDLVLIAFEEKGQDQHLLKTERVEPESFRLFFTAPADTLPRIKGLNFDESCLVYEATEHFDTITCWVTDTMFYRQQDTLHFEISFLETDTLGKLAPHTEELEIVPKKTWKKKWDEQRKLIDEWNKTREKKMKKAKEPLPYEANPYEKLWLDISCKPSGSLDPNKNPRFTSTEPLAAVDSSRVHFYIKQDSDWLPHPFLFLPEPLDKRSYTLYAEWESKEQYRFVADSAAFVSVLGKESRTIKQEFRVKKDEEYGSIFINVIAADTGAVVQLVGKSDKPVAVQRADKDGHANFFYIKPGEYYVKCFIDANGNDIWDTGDYRSGVQPEEVFYFPKPITLKANWDMEQDWNIRAIERTKQKPKVLLKAKGDKKKKSVHEKNLEREQAKKKK